MSKNLNYRDIEKYKEDNTSFKKTKKKHKDQKPKNA